MKKPRYVILEDDMANIDPLVIRDVGPWDKFPTVTNGAETVVRDLHARGQLPKGRRLQYIDSQGKLDEIEHDGEGRFLGIKPCQ